MKFSIIVPVYNVEKYIDKCLSSILNQTYKNYEVIVVNDGSPDNSQIIIDEYVKKDNRFKSYKKVNGGLSDARNYGINLATGDYLLFLDSDDYIEKELLFKLNDILVKNPDIDLIKFKFNFVTEMGELISKEEGYNEEKYIDVISLLKLEHVEPAWSYAYNKNFWDKNNFKYPIGKIHEDFGLTPYILLKSQTMYYLPYYGLNYVQREGSITKGSTKAQKRCYDTLWHFDNLSDLITKLNIDDYTKKYALSFIANGALNRAKLLKGQSLNKYLRELRKRKIYKYILDDNLSRKLKKNIIKINMKLYLLFLR